MILEIIGIFWRKKHFDHKILRTFLSLYSVQCKIILYIIMCIKEEHSLHLYA